MALTRAQLLMGDINNGAILTGQPQGVRPGGNGITIRTDGVIEVNPLTVVGLMKLGQTLPTATAAFNGYTWPTGAGNNRQQLTTDGTGVLSWEDSDHIPWSAKGQLIVGTGVETDIILNVGANTSLLVADSSTLSGLNYTDQIQTAILLPTGTSLQRPLVPNLRTGQFRWNTDLDSLEVYDGIAWEAVASEDPAVGTFVPQTVPASPTTETGSAVIPPGSTAERQTLPAPTAGNFRWNTDFDQLEVFDGLSWAQIPASTNFDYVLQTRPTGGFTASAIIPAGNSIQADPAAVGGWLRYNTDYNELQFFNGTDWDLIAPSQGGVSSFVQAATPTARNVGDIWYDTVRERESVWDGSAWVQPGVTQTGPRGAARLPYGNTVPDQPAAASVPGGLRLNTDTLQLEYSDGVAWRNPSFPSGTRLVFAQAAAPIGWTQDTTYDNYAIRIVSGGSGWTTGGSQPFTTSFANYTPSGTVDVSGLSVSGATGGASLNASQNGPHQHYLGGPGDKSGTSFWQYYNQNTQMQRFTGAGQFNFCPSNGNVENANFPQNTYSDGAGAAHAHSFGPIGVGGSANFNGGTTGQFNVQYIDMIVCTKN